MDSQTWNGAEPMEAELCDFLAIGLAGVAVGAVLHETLTTGRERLRLRQISRLHEHYRVMIRSARAGEAQPEQHPPPEVDRG